MSKDLGKSTSYAYYVDAGGTKTPQEYGEMLVNIDTVATRAEDAADAAAESATGALNSKNAAQTAATTATNKATEATTAAQTATTKAAEAQADADAAALDASQALSAASTATTKATEATTAAATATSAATTATTAKDDAVSAKTAAQTAQTGAETAAASVQSSAAQIATNAEDISQLKSDLSDVKNALSPVVQLNENVVFTDGYYIKTGGYNAAGDTVDVTPKTDNSSKYAIVSCAEGDKFYIKAKSYSTSRAWCFVTSENALISNSGVGSIEATITAPANAAKVIFNGDKTATPTEAYKIVGNDGFSNIVENIDNIISQSGNLLNHRTLINGKTISSQGVISDNVQYAITDEIAVEESTVYSYRNIKRFVYFNKAGSRIGNTNPSTSTGTITTPANTAYMIAMVMKFNTQIEKVYRSTEWQIVKGSVLPDYQQQQIIVNGYRIADSVSATHDNITAFRRWDKICFDKQPVVFAAQESDATNAEDRMTSAIIAKYDALMADNPLYISKTALGTASDGITTIYRYDFKTPGAKVASGSIPISANEKTKIILISGVHPEFGGIYGLYNAMREITNNPALANIKNGVHFIVIPTVNPYGIDTKNRKNANGVDIARNFEIDYVAGTDPTSATYAGIEPLSEPESQIVNAVLSENRDAIIFASCHSFQLSADNNVIWGSCASMYTTNVTAKVVEKLSYAWRNKYTSIIPQTIDTILGSAGISTESGSEGKQATKYGVQGLTLESSDYFPYDSQTPHTSFAISRASEVYLNFIATALGLWEASDPKDLNMIGLH